MAKSVLRGVVDDGTREVPLVNKFGKLICKVYFRPADFSILDRYDALMQDFDDIVKPLSALDIKNDGTAAFDEGWPVLKKVENNLKARINALFDMEEADAIFEKRNAFSSVGGEFFCTRVLTALGDVIQTAVKEEAALSEKRMAKYLKDHTGTVTADVGATPENAGD